MVIDRPYFMSNKKWWRYDLKKRIMVLTKEAPPKAVKSYQEFYKKVNDLYRVKLPE